MGDTVSTLTEEYRSTWDDPDTKKWKEDARSVQQNFYTSFEGKQWDVYSPEDYDLLCVKICIAVYGIPTKENNNMPDLEKIYDKSQRAYADTIKDKILHVYDRYSKLSQLHTGIVFVSCLVSKTAYTVPIFRVRINKSEESYFVDLQTRVYKSWKDWEENNVLPMMKYCYPRYGFYTCSGNNSYEFDIDCDVDLTFGTSPSCNVTARTGKVLDVGAGGIGLVTGVIGIAAMFTPVAPVVLLCAGAAGTTSAIYGAGRSIHRLVDKGTHEQSLLDLESILCGLSIAALPLHAWMASVNSTFVAGARAGRNFTSLQLAGGTALKFTTIALDSSMLVIGFVNLYNKKQEDNLEALDVLQFSLSVFFFSNTLIQPKTANGIIHKAQTDYFKEYRANMTNSEAQKSFDKFVGDFSVKKGARIARTINRINSPNEFFEKVSTAKSVKVKGGRNVTINKKLTVNPNRFNQLTKENAETLLSNVENHKNARQVNQQFKRFMKEERLALNVRRNDTIQKIADVFGTDTKNLKDFKINDKELFADLTGADIDRLQTVFENTAGNYNKDVIFAAIALADEFKCNNINDLNSCIELIAMEKKHKTRSEYRQFLTDIRNDPHVMEQFKNSVTDDCNTAKGILTNTELKFNSPLTAVYHYRKHGHEFGIGTTMDVYFDQIPKNLFREEHLFRNVYDQNGMFQIKTYANQSNHQFGVLRVAEDGSTSIATVFTNEKFFENWSTKSANAQEYLQYSTARYNKDPTPITSYFDTFAQNMLNETGTVINQILVHKHSNVQRLDNFRGNDDDMENLKELGDILADLPKYIRSN
ncbi:uncharacterized protein LOC143153070 [Ptiloglossa arizonensis]|uniref:uncharacterized protein LOC143153070 n=1 Tax=Ptiloglossa arizonensis TaxID=3350558 RepID=UPI003F9F0075